MTPAARQLAELPPCRCLWGIGDPRSDAFRWCGARTARGQPYCARHARRAVYVPVGDEMGEGKTGNAALPVFIVRRA